MRTADFYYDLPDEAIAQKPVEPRDASRLLDARDGTDHTFASFPDLLESGDLMVLNRTRVRRARLRGRRSGTGGVVELLLLRPQGTGWEALIRPARRMRPGVEVEVEGAVLRVAAGPSDGKVVMEAVTGSFDAAIEAGEIPLPPYICLPISDPERYQTVFGDSVGSAAAPTAGLHITEAVLSRMAERGIRTAMIDLDVGLDTFRPISSERVEDHQIHTERFTVGHEVVAAIESTRRGGGRVVAVGTTVVRSLETAAAARGRVVAMSGETSLYITPGYEFRVVDVMLTNFHVPGSTLLVLLAAFMGERWRGAYDIALERGYRFLSFGDAMLAERSP